MRLCQCGGQIRSHPLPGGRDAWTCSACGRYEAMEPRSAMFSRDVGRKQPPPAASPAPRPTIQAAH